MDRTKKIYYENKIEREKIFEKLKLKYGEIRVYYAIYL